ncbi:alpha,alpha-phosphotrehalase, partial [Staphylococcus aureus]
GDIVPRFMDHDHLFVYERHYKNQQWLVIANFSASAVDLPEGLAREGCVVIQTGTVENNTISGFGAIVIETNA